MMTDPEHTRLRIEIPVSPLYLFVLLFAVEMVILVADLVVFHTVDQKDLRQLFDLNLEANLPTAFSVLQALAVAGVALALSRTPKDRLRRYGWLAIAAFFAYIALDDAAQIHERVATAWSELAKAEESATLIGSAVGSFESYYWQLLILPFFVAAGIAMAVFAKRELGGWQVAWLFFAGLGFYANAVVLDYFDAYQQLYYPIGGLLDWQPETAKHMARNTEEFIEMFGTTCILIAFIRHLVHQSSEGNLP